MFSVCVIAKNEEKNIEKCLQSFKGIVSDIVVADTGSSDRTKELASRFTDRIYDYKWQDDFAAAKNFAISKAANEFVMVVDADEFLEPMTAQEAQSLSRQIVQHPDWVGRVYLKNSLRGDAGEYYQHEWISRIFSREKFHYEGSVHEQVVSLVDNEFNYKTYRTNASFVHVGYGLPLKERREKAERNIRLLKKELERLQEDSMNKKAQSQLPYILYQLGKGYFMAQDYERACGYFTQGLSYDLNPRLEYVIDMVESYGYALLNSGQAETALLLENIYIEFGNCADFKFLMGLIYMNNAMFDQAVTEFLKAATYKECRAQGVNSYAAYYNVGVIYECLEEIKKAKTYYEKCSGYQPAEERLAAIQKI